MYLKVTFSFKILIISCLFFTCLLNTFDQHLNIYLKYPIKNMYKYIQIRKNFIYIDYVLFRRYLITFRER